ncbi:MAG: hypothetical protein ABSB78_05480 [Bacteroidota bacterium]
MKASLVTRFSKISLLVALFLFLSGCTTRILDFTVISSKNTNIKVKDTGKGERVSGEDMVVQVIVPFGQPQVKSAVDRAIEKAGPGYDALLDGVIFYKYNVFLFFGTLGYSVEGTPIKTSQLITELKNQGIDPAQYFAQHNLVWGSSGKTPF